MPSHFEKLTQQDILALRAATDALPSSVKAWEDLGHQTSFDQIDVNTQRIAPAIYANSRSAGAFRDRDRLKGAYKHAWSRNTRSFYALAPVAQKLESKQVNYRLIKGAAVQLTLGDLGARIMGDIDIVVSRDDIELINQILISEGFKPNFQSACAAFHAGIPREALNYNKDECHVDVHIAEHKEPTRLYTSMLELPPTTVEYGDTSYLIAEPSLLLLAAAAHGFSNFGPTDLIQACTDITLLSQATSPDLIQEYSKRTQTQLAVDYIYRVIESANLDHFRDGVPRQLLLNKMQRIWISQRLLMKGLKGRLSLLNRLSRSYHERRLRISEISPVWRKFSGRRMQYVMWLAMGRFSSVERFLLRRKVTFLKAPQNALQLPYSVEPFQSFSDENISINRASEATADWRFAVRLAETCGVLSLTIRSKFFDNFDANLFWMGAHHVRIISGDKSMLHIVFRDVPQISEFSIRPVHQLCSACAESLSDMELEFNVG